MPGPSFIEYRLMSNMRYPASLITLKSECSVLGTCYDLLLVIGAKIIEVVAVAGHTYHQVTILFGMLLCIAESSGIHNVELDMMSSESEIGTDKLTELIEVLFFLEDLGNQTLVQQRTARKTLVQLAE